MKYTQEILNQAMQAFNAGEFTRVISMLSKVYGQHPLAKMLYATALGRVANFTKSFEIFDSLQSNYPRNTDVAYNYGLLLKEAGQFEDAQRQFVRAIEINPNYHVALHALGNLKSGLGQHEGAQLAFEQAVALNPSSNQYKQSLGKCLYQQEKWASLKTLTKKQESYLNDRTLAELYIEACYRIRSRIELIKNGGSLSLRYPDSYSLHYFLFLSALESKRYVDAQKYLKISLSVADESDKDELLTYSSYISWLLNPSSENLDNLNRRFALTKNIRLLELAFNINDNLGRLVDAENALNKTKFLDIEGNSGKGVLQSALLEFAKDNFEKSLLITDDYLKADPMSLPHLYQKIRILDKLKRYDDADAVIHYIAQNLQNFNSSKFTDLTAGVRLSDFGICPKPIVNVSNNQTNILFIVGFPRSGTTLAENLLLKNMDIELLEETDAVETFYARMVEDGFVDKNSGNLKPSSTKELTALANEYISHLSTYSHCIDDSKFIVDKMPLNIPFLPAMLTLFPNAKVLCCLRDPRAIALSCFQFEEINLYNIEQFSAAYDSVFSCWEKVHEILGNRVMCTKYEEILNDSGAFTNTIISFMQGTDKLVVQNKKIDARLVLTPSYFQVNKPIYRSSIDKYLHYPSAFSKVPAKLTKWINKWEY